MFVLFCNKSVIYLMYSQPAWSLAVRGFGDVGLKSAIGIESEWEAIEQ